MKLFPIINMRPGVFIFALTAGFVFLSHGALFAQNADWTVVSYQKRDYVTLRDFCKFYNFTYSPPDPQVPFHTQNKQFDLALKYDSREFFLNGVRHWLSFAIAEKEGDWLISRTDLATLFEPVLRPRSIENKPVVRGVVIDPGHGGTDNGALSARGNMEKTYTLDTARRLEALLKADNIPVVLTRHTDLFIPLEERVKIAESYPDYLFVSIHFNYADRSARGIETYCLSPRGAASTGAEGRVRLSDVQRLPGNRNDPLNALLAEEIHRQVIKLNPGDVDADRGVKRARFVVLKDNALPAALVEGGFLTNRLEASMIDQPKYRQDLAIAIKRGLQNFTAKVSSPLTLPEETDPVVVKKAIPVSPPPTPVAVKVPPPKPLQSATEMRAPEVKLRTEPEDPPVIIFQPTDRPASPAPGAATPAPVKPEEVKSPDAPDPSTAPTVP